MKILNLFFKYRWSLLGFVILFNTALFLKFIFEEKGISNASKKKSILKIKNHFKKEKFLPEIFQNQKEIEKLGSFLLQHCDIIIAYHIQPQFKPFKKDDGSFTMYKKDGKTFYFNQCKEIYQYVPEKLRDSLQILWKRAADGLFSGFVLEIPQLGYSVDSSKCNLRLYAGLTSKMRKNFVSHCLYFNRKFKNKLSSESQADYLVKDTLLKPNIRYVITALVNLDK